MASGKEQKRTDRRHKRTRDEFQDKSPREERKSWDDVKNGFGGWQRQTKLEKEGKECITNDG